MITKFKHPLSEETLSFETRVDIAIGDTITLRYHYERDPVQMRVVREHWYVSPRAIERTYYLEQVDAPKEKPAPTSVPGPGRKVPT